MTDDWRLKYLELLREQEAEVAAQQARLTQLRRALVRLGVAADGLDPDLDQALTRLRGTLKAADWEGLASPLEAVEAAVREYESRRQQQTRQLRQAFDRLCRQLLDLGPPKPIKQALKQLLKSLKTRLAQPVELPQVITELAALQQASLEAGEQASDKVREGGWRRLWRTQPDRTLQPSTAPVLSVAQETLEPVADLLRQLLADIELLDDNPAQTERLATARQRIAENLQWQDLLPTLEDVRDLVTQNQLAASQTFADYLVQVNQELQAIYQLATHAGKTNRAQLQARATLNARVGQELNDLSREVADARELDSLKSAVSRRIEEIRDAVVNDQADPEAANADMQTLIAQVAQLEQQAQQAQANLQEQWQRARQDSLTGLPNREAYHERSEQEYLRWRRYQHPLSLAVLDIDHFKQVNDNYGHQAGDRVLKLVSRELAKRLREVDFIARIGGEEFVVLLPDTAKAGARKALELLREELSQVPFHHKQSPVPITLSIGLSEFAEGDTVASVFERADKALYEAKTTGRNRCCVDY